MENIQPQQPTPILIRIIAILMLLGGVAWLAVAGLSVFLLGGFGLILAIPPLLTAAVIIVLSFGIRKMKKWALYIFTILTILQFVGKLYSVMGEDTEASTRSFLGVILQVLALIYLWIHRKKFR